MKKYLLFTLHFSLFISLISCTNSLGKKGEWNTTYKKEFMSNCEAEIQNEKSLVKIDSLTVSKICECISSKAEKEFAPLKMEEENSQTQMKTISTDCARGILMKN